nr:carboxylesterase family protein [Kibdelosporangium sp. MJ126-NF4]CEL18190.1 putative carboxylesterase type B [Kibdelosporangium sp. MJ126-NF4]CTQ90580.1 putative carboxylesterase type B [Kibdelosporangium sp. MJ126-NF4]
MKLATVIAVTAAIAFAGVPAAASASGDIARTEYGPVRGTVTQDYRQFQGIPYAAAPIRWKSPQPPQKWTTLRDATKPGERCAQAGDFIGDEPSDSENCLTVNVTAPKNARKLPVMVWIHGGGFFSGSGDIYNPSRLATRGDVVVVTLNYRLGVFGFLDHPDLPHGGNFGLEDQQLALKWVRRNIANFGGDPNQTTLFGESAGGISTCAHLAAPGSAGLFQRAIIQSGPCALTTQWPFGEDGTWVARPRQQAERTGVKFARSLDCDTVDCLRGKPVKSLMDASSGGQGYGPVYGTRVLPLSPAQALAVGAFRHVPVIQGTTKDEHQTFQAGYEEGVGRPTGKQDYDQGLIDHFGPNADKVKARYPLDDGPGAVLAKIWTDYSWSCTALRTERMLTRRTPTYTYEFADENAPWFADADKPSFPIGAHHAGELQYLFPGVYNSKPLPKAQQDLADQMIRYWTRFAHTGDPNGPGSPTWSRDSTLSLAPGNIKPVDFAAEHQCGFWDSLEQSRRAA